MHELFEVLGLVVLVMCGLLVLLAAALVCANGERYSVAEVLKTAALLGWFLLLSVFLGNSGTNRNGPPPTDRPKPRPPPPPPPPA
ncbi:MAG: hypothetical protein AB7E55_32770 [Pigmentiphaga sp.]